MQGEYDRRLVATDSRPELDSILGTVPGLVFRSRIAPEPYLIEFVSDEMSSIAGYPANDFMGIDVMNWPIPASHTLWTTCSAWCSPSTRTAAPTTDATADVRRTRPARSESHTRPPSVGASCPAGCSSSSPSRSPTT